MEFVLEKDVRRLIDDTGKVKQGLDLLEKDHAAWIRDRERKDLLDILGGVKKLESDVSLVMSDCFSLSQVKRNNGIRGDLHQAFKNLNILFEDLKMVREDLDKSSVDHRELEQLEIDWARFRKTVAQIQEDLEKE
ncbi:MAG: hypothetical protein LJE96_16820 [Deltaproteobacteria bacterium]|nr:hypothetical protein [Deltaproteobacteria bacterium]